MGVFNILKRKKEGKGEEKLDIPPPPPIPKPVAKLKPKLILSKKIPEVPKFKSTIPRFEPKIPESVFKPSFKPEIIPKPSPIFKPEFKQSIKEKIIPKLSIPKFKPAVSKPAQIMPSLEKSYIDVESFRDIMGHVNEIKKKIKDSEEVLVRLNEIKNKEDKEFGKWHSKFEDVQRKLVYIDKFLGG